MDQKSSTLHATHAHGPHALRLHPSLLRLAVPLRLALAAAFAVLLWLAVLWAHG